VSEDRTLPRIPAPTSATFGTVAAVPYCSVCGDEVPDLNVDHHVCVPDPKGEVVTPYGRFTKTTRDVAAAAWQAKEEKFRAAEAAAKVPDADGA
jgi:hypothetical protein